MIAALMPFIFIAYYIFLIKKRKSISYDLKHGLRCFSCKEEIEMSDIDKYNLLSDILNKLKNNEDAKKFTICKSCERNQKLDDLVTHKGVSRINKLKIFLISEKSNKLNLWLIFGLVLFLLIDVFFRIFFKINFFSYIYNIYLCFYWCIMIYKQKITSIK
jgi:hypothetical protein